MRRILLTAESPTKAKNIQAMFFGAPAAIATLEHVCDLADPAPAGAVVSAWCWWSSSS